MVKVKTLDISGMGGSYELGCQKMLWIGIEWIKDKPLSIWEGTGSLAGRDRKTGQEIHFYGLMQTSEPLKELEQIWFNDPFLSAGGITGAMHEAVLHHLYYIHKYGYDKWLEKGKGRIIEVELPP